MKLHSTMLTVLVCTALMAACGSSDGGSGGTPMKDTTTGGGNDAGPDGTVIPVDGASNTTDAGGSTNPDGSTNPGDTTGGNTDGSAAVDSGDPGGPCSCAGKECGFIPGCPMSCGACQAGKKCVNNLCSGTPQPTGKKLGSYCGPTKDCQPPPFDDNEAAYTQAQQLYRACLNAQCEGAACFGNVCTNQCKIKKDEVLNATGEKGQDGIEDPDVDFSDCADAAEGPQGKKFRCVEVLSEAQVSQGQSAQYCFAGETFKPCKNNADCPANEACQPEQIFGTPGLFCFPKYKNPDGSAGQGSSLLCNGNIVEGDIKLCENGFCTGIGCRDFCKDDKDCNTAKAGDCKAGKCPSGGDCKTDLDCSAWMCEKGLKIYSDSDQTFDLCSPKACDFDGDCPDEFFCRIYYNGVQNPKGDPDPDDPNVLTMPDWGNLCVRRAENAAKPGEPCDAFPQDTDETYKKCESINWYCSLGNGVCSNICKSDADCPKDMKCPVMEYPFDLDDDKSYETFLNIGVCNTAVGNVKKDPCYSNNECKGAAADGKDQVCKGWTYKIDLPGQATGVDAKQIITAAGLCVDGDAKKGNYGDLCGAKAPIKHCNSGLCIGLTSGDGVCIDLCAKRADCKDPVSIGGQTAKSYCSSLNIGGANGTVEPYDDYARAYCLWTQSSVDDCSATKTCKTPTEACTARAMYWGPEKKPNIEYWCNNVQNYAANQNDPPPPQPSKEVGDECDLESDLIQCKSSYCMRDVKTGKGYCSKPCNADAECPSSKGLFCNKDNMSWPGVPRLDKEMAGLVPMCMKKKSCISCQYDYQCAGDYKCTNIGKGGTLANLRCAPACTTDADCAKSDGGATCVPASDPEGKPLAHKVCKPGCS